MDHSPIHFCGASWSILGRRALLLLQCSHQLAGKLLKFLFAFQLNFHCPFQRTPAESRQLNKDCILLDFYDNHDIWHFLSASAMFCTFMVRHNSTCIESSVFVLLLVEHRFSQWHSAFSIRWPMYTTNVFKVTINWFETCEMYTRANCLHKQL